MTLTINQRSNDGAFIRQIKDVAPRSVCIDQDGDLLLVCSESEDCHIPIDNVLVLWLPECRIHSLNKKTSVLPIRADLQVTDADRKQLFKAQLKADEALKKEKQNEG